MLKRIAQLESELNKAKTSYSVIHFHDQLAKTQRLELHNRTKTKQVEELETHIKALGKVADRHAKEAEVAKDKYKKLFDAVQKQAQEQSEKSKLLGPAVSEQAEALSVSYYKDLVIEKDKQINSLKARIKQLNTNDKRTSLASKRHEDQQNEASRRLAMLNAKLEAAQAANRELTLASGTAALLQERNALAQVPASAAKDAPVENVLSELEDTWATRDDGLAAYSASAHGTALPGSPESQRAASLRPSSATARHIASFDLAPATSASAVVRPQSALAGARPALGDPLRRAGGRPLSATFAGAVRPRSAMSHTSQPSVDGAGGEQGTMKAWEEEDLESSHGGVLWEGVSEPSERGARRCVCCGNPAPSPLQRACGVSIGCSAL
jgi:septal ring factor EnvC (AmiA/AmiB activator)